MKRFFIIALIALFYVSLATAENENSEFTELQHVFAAAGSLINNEDDRQKLFDAVETIMQLSKMRLRKRNMRMYMPALMKCKGLASERLVDVIKVPLVISSRRRSTCELRISTSIFFLTDDDDCNLFIDISRGGGNKDELEKKYGEKFDYVPDRYYEFNIKKNTMNTDGFYWD